MNVLPTEYGRIYESVKWFLTRSHHFSAPIAVQIRSRDRLWLTILHFQFRYEVRKNSLARVVIETKIITKEFNSKNHKQICDTLYIVVLNL